MRTVGLFEAKNKLSELANLAASGEEVIITRHGKPLVKLVMMDDADERRRRHVEAMEDIKALRAKLKYRASIEELIADKNSGRR